MSNQQKPAKTSKNPKLGTLKLMSDFLETYLGRSMETWKPMETYETWNYVAKWHCISGVNSTHFRVSGSKFLETRKPSEPGI